MLSWAHIGLAGSFGALLVGWLVVVTRGLYLARHLFTLYHAPDSRKTNPMKKRVVCKNVKRGKQVKWQWKLQWQWRCLQTEHKETRKKFASVSAWNSRKAHFCPKIVGAWLISSRLNWNTGRLEIQIQRKHIMREGKLKQFGIFERGLWGVFVIGN